jgi:hypothetical protein
MPAAARSLRILEVTDWLKGGLSAHEQVPVLGRGPGSSG